MSIVPNIRIECETCPIRHRAVCARCDSEELKELESIKFYKNFAAGQTIALTGDKLDIVASVVLGTVTLSRSMKDGRTQILGLLLPSDFMGRPGREEITYDVTALTDVTLCCFHKKAFENMLIRTPHVSERLVEMSLDELDAARDWMLLLGRKTAREKIASMIMFVVRRTTSPGRSLTDAHFVKMPIAREEMANYLGLTIETVSRQLTKLKSEGIIGLEGKRGILIPNIHTLMAQSGDTDELPA